MDLYLSPPDSFNLQEMLDCDIKCEMGDGFGLECDLPPLELGEEDSHPAWIHHGNSNSSFELDFFGTESSASLMVNPHTIMPLPLPLQTLQQLKREQPKIEEEVVKSEPPPSPVNSERLEEEEEEEEEEGEEGEEYELELPISSSSRLRLMTVAADAPSRMSLSLNNSTKSVYSSAIGSNNNLATPNGHIKSEAAASPYTPTSAKSKKPVVNSKKQLCLMDDSILYPKPAYSYSCLIALALKNSPSGSLPVSEIYNFMCRHFPYFKSAPNGWKNSVRHNLSLNKCFEKIEKPLVGPGGAQRKGCLWAMNPQRLNKMDDEVAKWSRKDPNAIRKSMLNPDQLELLERGELQVGWQPGDFAPDDNDELSNEEANTNEDECSPLIANTSTSMLDEQQQRAASTKQQQQQQQQPRVEPIRIRTTTMTTSQLVHRTQPHASKVRPTTTTTTAEVVSGAVAEEDDDEEEEEEDEEEEDEEGEEEDEEEEEEEEEEDDDDGPQPIGSSDESEDELARMPPSLAPFEPRLALGGGRGPQVNGGGSRGLMALNRSRTKDVELTENIMDVMGWPNAVSSRGIYQQPQQQLQSPQTLVFDGYDEDDVNSESESEFVGVAASSSVGVKRKRSAPGPLARIEGKYVCVKRKVPQICRSSVK